MRFSAQRFRKVSIEGVMPDCPFFYVDTDGSSNESKVKDFMEFTDIEFNPSKSICTAELFASGMV
jgi:hypothetical protein